MSLWTPGGEHPPGPEGPEGAGGQGPGNEPLDPEDLSPEDREKLQAMQEEMAQVREQLLGAPASVVLANHAMGMYELATIHLTATEPKLTEDRKSTRMNSSHSCAARMPSSA